MTRHERALRDILAVTAMAGVDDRAARIVIATRCRVALRTLPADERAPASHLVGGQTNSDDANLAIANPGEPAKHQPWPKKPTIRPRASDPLRRLLERVAVDNLPRLRKFVRGFIPPFATAIRTHYRHHGTLPRILNPQTFNEKICHRKIFDRRKILTQFADKLAVRDYVEQRLGSAILPKLYHVTQNPADIPFETLPKQFVVKPTHGCGWVRLVRDKSKLDTEALIAECKNWLRQSYYEMTREWQYKDIMPRIIVEEFIDDGSGDAPVDYKILVFHGTGRIIHTHKDRFSAHKVTYYDRSWQKFNVLGLVDGVHGVTEDIPRPARLDEMIAAAEALSEGIDFIRVDFYATKEKIYFGELTNTPANGVVRYSPIEFDLYLGQFWDVKRRHDPTPSRRC